MADTKHVGRIVKTNKKCGVVYRVVPGEPENCVIVMTESLDAADHDSLINLINSATAQDAYELGEAMARSQLSDGSNMLARFHKTGRMQKVPTSTVDLTPNNNASINLAELNKIIAEQKGVTIADLALGGAKPAEEGVTNAADAYTTDTPVREMGAMNEAVTTDEGVITDEMLAKKFRSDADRLSKEAADLRRQAEELVPTKKATPKKKVAAKKTAAGA
tara:strand:- start:1736 stop:2392 length:657 start_codon:yes stop_codon:yes gene_type:complete